MSPYVYVYIAVIVVLCATAVFCFVYFGKRDKKRSNALKEKAKNEAETKKMEEQVKVDIVKNYDEAIVETPQPVNDLPNDAFENYVWEKETPKTQAGGKNGTKLNSFASDEAQEKKDSADEDDFDDIDAKFKEYEEFLRKNLQFDDDSQNDYDDSDAQFDFDMDFGQPNETMGEYGSQKYKKQNQSVDEIVTNLPPKARDVVISEKISDQNQEGDAQNDANGEQ